MKRFLIRCFVAAGLGVITTLAVSWVIAAFVRRAPATTGQSVFVGAGYRVPFGRTDAFGATALYWRAVAEDGSRWGQADDLYPLPAWSRASRLSGPFPSSDDFPRLAQTFEVGTGWPWVAMRSEFKDVPQGQPRPAAGPYITVSGIGLPTRRVPTGRSTVSEARALPVDVVWPGFLADAGVYSAYWLALIAGVAAARRVARASRGRCPGCGYDASGLPAGSVCPECGSELSELARIGRRWPVVVVTAVVLVAGTAVFGAVGLAQWRGWRIERLEPMWMLRQGAAGPNVAAALEEINRRMADKSVHAGTIAALVGDALEAQADLSRPWNYRWGDLVESARAAGGVPDEQWRRYAEQSVVLSLRPRSPVRVGDQVPFAVMKESRVGRGRMLGMELKTVPPTLDGVAGRFEPNPDPRYATPLDPKATIAVWTDGQMYPGLGRSRGWVVQPPDLTQGRFGLIPVWPRATRVGQSELVVSLEMRVMENTYGPSGPGTMVPPRPTKQTDLVTKKLELRARLDVVGVDVQTVKLRTNDDAMPAEVLGAIHVVDASKATAWAPAPKLERDGDRVRAVGTLELPRTPLALAFDVVWRRGEREWIVGRWCRAAGQSPTTITSRGEIRGFEPGPVEIVLRPSTEAARNEPDVFEIWGREIVLPGVMVEGIEPAARPGK